MGTLVNELLVGLLRYLEQHHPGIASDFSAKANIPFADIVTTLGLAPAPAVEPATATQLTPDTAVCDPEEPAPASVATAITSTVASCDTDSPASPAPCDRGTPAVPRDRSPIVRDRSRSRSPIANRLPVDGGRGKAPRKTPVTEEAQGVSGCPVAPAPSTSKDTGRANTAAPSDVEVLVVDEDAMSTDGVPNDKLDSDADDGFQTVKKRKRTKRPDPPTDVLAAKTVKTNKGTAAPASGKRSGAKPSQGRPRLPPSDKTPPAIYMQDKSAWPRVADVMKERKISYSRATSTFQGMRVQVNTSEDFRNLTRFLTAIDIGYHSKTLNEDRQLRVVIRGMPKELETEYVKNDLTSQGFPVREVHRMRKGSTSTSKSHYDMVLVVLDRTQEGLAIFDAETVCGLSELSIEPPNKRGLPGQCHRCQYWGHSARNCTERPRCVKCRGDHGTAECSRLPNDPEPPSCVICGAVGHTANYRGCPKAPRRKRGGRATKKRGPKANAPIQPPLLTQRNFPELPKKSAKPDTAVGNAATAVPVELTETNTVPTTSEVAIGKSKNAWGKPSAEPTIPKQAAKPGTPVPSGAPAHDQGGLFKDLATVAKFLKAIDLQELRVLATKIRETQNSPIERLLAIAEHESLVNAIWQYQP